jgi:lysyl-tRNA synthetase class 2
MSATLSVLRLRARLLARIRSFFAERGVLEVETPALSRAATTDPAIESLSSGTGLWLHTSPELAMKRLLARGTGDIYQICRVFRRGELGRWHQPEFTMLEWYRTRWTERDLIREVSELLTHVLAGDYEISGNESRTYREAFAEVVGADPFGDRRTIESALQALSIEIPADLDHDGLLDLAITSVLVPAFDPAKLTFLTDYPASQAALARIKPTSPPVAARFEGFLGGLELANGFHELGDAVEQRGRFRTELETRRRRGQLEPPVDEPFLAALEEGLPDCAGVAVGFDRIVALAAGADSIAEVVAFAHTGDVE